MYMELSVFLTVKKKPVILIIGLFEKGRRKFLRPGILWVEAKFKLVQLETDCLC